VPPDRGDCCNSVTRAARCSSVMAAVWLPGWWKATIRWEASLVQIHRCDRRAKPIRPARTAADYADGFGVPTPMLSDVAAEMILGEFKRRVRVELDLLTLEGKRTDL